MDRSLASHSLLYKIHVAAKIGADSQNLLLEPNAINMVLLGLMLENVPLDSQLGKQIKTEVENSAIKEASIARLAVAEQEKHRQTQLSRPENALVRHMDLLGKNLQVVFRKTSNIWMTDLKVI